MATTRDFDDFWAGRVGSDEAGVNNGGALDGADFATPAALATKADTSTLTAHTSATEDVHGSEDTSALLTTADIGDSVQAHDDVLDAFAAAGFSTGPNGRVVIAGVDVGQTPWANMVMVNGWTANSARYRREGGATRVDVRGLNGSAASSNVFATLPAGYRIGDNSAAPLVAGGAVTSALLPCLIWQNGDLSANRATATGSNVLRGTFAYPASGWPS